MEYFNGGLDGRYVSESYGSPPAQFRNLMKFQDLHMFVPSGSYVVEADITLTFINWNAATNMALCFITKPWHPFQVVRLQCFHVALLAPLLVIVRFKSTGWRYNRYDTSIQAPTQWTKPGAWADCDPRSLSTFTVPSASKYGNVTRTIPIDPSLVNEWIESNGATNYGVLVRVIGSGGATLMGHSTPRIDQRPALRVRLSTSPPPPITTPTVFTDTPRVIWVDSSTGNDISGTGQAEYPYASARKGVFEAYPNDVIQFRSGVYDGGLSVERPFITIQSAPGHWAVIAAPLNDPISTVNVFTIRPEAHYGVIRNLEITGGYYYGIMFFSYWENYASKSDRIRLAAAPGDYLLENLRIHHTGSSCVKLTMKTSNVTIRNSELFKCGDRLRTNGHGVEAVQARSIVVEDSYIHDVISAGIHLAGGTRHSVIQRNYIAHVDFGINVGFATDFEYMDNVYNPRLYEHLYGIFLNNIITSTRQAGMNMWAANGAVVMHNSFWNVQEATQNAILLNSYQHTTAPGSPTTGCSNISIIGNVMVKSRTARVGPLVQIRKDGLEFTSEFRMGYNVYLDSKGLSGKVWRWGVGVMLEDERLGLKFVGNLSAWKRHCVNTLQQDFCDIGSVEADPLLDEHFTPVSCSPGNAIVPSSLWPDTRLQWWTRYQEPLVDFHGNVRTSLNFDAGAVSSEFGPSGEKEYKNVPPVPKAFAALSPYMGMGHVAVYYDNYSWPFNFWVTRKCKDLYVDAVEGNDNQAFNYESNYVSFKSISKALVNINQCDRILLRGGQTHLGPFGIYRPNVTIMTNPTDTVRATVLCASTDRNCIITGEGLYHGAAEITLSNFNIVMTGGASVSNCIMLNEGYGGGSSPYWKFYIETAKRQQYSRGRTLISDMDISGCPLHGIKLSTFITGVEIRNVKIRNIGGTGVEMRNGNDVWVHQSTIENVGGSGILMGGGSKGNLLERNTIRRFGGRGVLVGSDATEVKYMDVDYATKSIGGSWHDAVDIVIRNNVIAHGQGAGIGVYSAKNVTIVHNTIFDVGINMQGGIVFSLSPKLLNATTEVLPSNEQIVMKNNIIHLAPGNKNLPVVELRIMQGTILNSPPRYPYPNTTKSEGACSSAMTKTSLRGAAALSSFPPSHSKGDTSAMDIDTEAHKTREHRKLLSAQEMAQQAVNAPGYQGRNKDGTCPTFPDSNAWHQPVRSLPVHRKSESIKIKIGIGSTMHADFGGGVNLQGEYVPYGIPFTTVNTMEASSPSGESVQPLVDLKIRPTGYPQECDYPLKYPIPLTAPVEGSALNCPDTVCPGDRHVIIIDNSTCMLYETFRSFPPGVTGGSWEVDIAVKFNLMSNKLRPLGFTSSDAAGLPVYPGLVTFDDLIVRKKITHAMRFTGRNSRPAYSLPATHFAANGDKGVDSPWMGMRVRLNSSFDCSALKPASRVFCIGLQEYGGIFADNGSPWYFTGEATTKWIPYLSELSDISLIPATAIEVLDSGCICLDANCVLADCNGQADPLALPVYSAVADLRQLDFDYNMYFKIAHVDVEFPTKDMARVRFVDRRAGDLGEGFDGTLDDMEVMMRAWKRHARADKNSHERNARVNELTYQTSPGSGARAAAPSVGLLTDYFGKPVVAVDGKVDIGVLISEDDCKAGLSGSTYKKVGNGICNDVANTPQCHWDNGDCCQASCLANSGTFYQGKCGIQGYNCVDARFRTILN